MKLQAILSLLLFTAVLVVNALANALPINGMNTGEVSALYPNLFVPDGLTFSIWGVIYLLLLGYTAIGLVLAFKGEMPPTASAVWHKINPWFQCSCLLNMGWILVWHYLQVGLSLVIMLLLLLVLLRMFVILLASDDKLSPPQRLLIQLPFVVYLAWICVAAVANTTAWLVYLGWTGLGWPPEAWAIGMIGILGALSWFVTGRLNQPAFGLVAAWACLGIYRAQYGVNTTVAFAGMAVAILVTAVSVYAWIFNRRVVRQF